MWCKEGWSDATCCEGLTCVSVDVADGMLIYLHIYTSLVIYLSTCLVLYLRNNMYRHDRVGSLHIRRHQARGQSDCGSAAEVIFVMSRFNEGLSMRDDSIGLHLNIDNCEYWWAQYKHPCARGLVITWSLS